MRSFHRSIHPNHRHKHMQWKCITEIHVRSREAKILAPHGSTHCLINSYILLCFSRKVRREHLGTALQLQHWQRMIRKKLKQAQRCKVKHNTLQLRHLTNQQKHVGFFLASKARWLFSVRQIDFICRKRTEITSKVTASARHKRLQGKRSSYSVVQQRWTTSQLIADLLLYNRTKHNSVAAETKQNMNRGILKDRKWTIFCDKEAQSLQGTKIVLRQVAGIISPSNVQVNKKDRQS